MRFLPVVLALTLLVPATAEAYRAPCVPGEREQCTWTKAKLVFVADGDTVDVRYGGRTRSIRVTGINAMELQTYSRTPSKRRGDCHGREAAALVDRLASKQVRLAAQRQSSASGKRLRRSVWFKRGGKWVDLGRAQLEAGLALWLPNDVEYAHNREYARLAAEAIRAQRGLYDPDACGAGPDANVSIAVNWDADGNDGANPNGEWVDIRNAGAAPLSLAGWFFRDSYLRRSTKANPPGYEFPAAATVPPGGSLRLHMGCGSNTARAYYWCQDGTVFENVSGAPKHAGDGGYLFDPDRDLRASFIYPCVVACVDPAAGRVRIDPHPNRPEAMTIENTSAAAVDLGDHVLKLRNRGKAAEYVFGHVFPPGTRIEAGGSLVYEHPTDNRYADNGGVVELRTLDDQLTTCAAWGFGSC